MSIRELNLTKEQHEWLNGWLELWGAWVYSGRLEKRMSSVIAKFMESVEREMRRGPSAMAGPIRLTESQ